MTRRLTFVVVAVSLLIAGCSRLGIGDHICEPHARVPSRASILAAQAVPTARYTPCFVSIDAGWDAVEFEAESGRTGIAVHEGSNSFLAAVLTESCDVGSAREVDSRHIDIRRFESISHTPSVISVAIVPVEVEQFSYAIELIEAWEGVTLKERPVRVTMDDETTMPVVDRVQAAIEAHDFVWVLDELDAAEGTIELRSSRGGVISRLKPMQALDEIARVAPEPRYEGNWFFTFEGGCITYTFRAEGRMADAAAEVAERYLGFYPAYRLRASRDT